jgi:hypothetical protein
MPVVTGMTMLILVASNACVPTLAVALWRNQAKINS